LSTLSTIGVRKGACFLLEKLLGRKLLYTACRHHIHELLVETTFEEYFGSSTSPEPPILNRFRQAWAAIDKTAFEPLQDKRLNRPFARGLTREVLQFLTMALQGSDRFPRGDYKECAELCLLILGGKLPDDYQFKMCGACHHARWMAKVTYSFKIYLFRYIYQL
jgi:hypothetical protein